MLKRYWLPLRVQILDEPAALRAGDRSRRIRPGKRGITDRPSTVAIHYLTGDRFRLHTRWPSYLRDREDAYPTTSKRDPPCDQPRCHQQRDAVATYQTACGASAPRTAARTTLLGGPHITVGVRLLLAPLHAEIPQSIRAMLSSTDEYGRYGFVSPSTPKNVPLQSTTRRHL